MRITDFELQTQSGQLWLDIIERLAAKDAEISEIRADRDRVAKLLADARAAWDSQDLAKIQQLAIDADKTAKDKAIEAAQAELETAQQKLAELSA